MRAGRVAGVCAVAALAWLAGRLAAQQPAESTPVAGYWLRLYPLPAYGSIWRMTLVVPDFQKGLPKVQSALEKRGGQPAAPLENMAGSAKAKFQQLVYRLPAASAEAALGAVQKLGQVEELQKNPGINPAVREEVAEKLSKLKAETASHAEALRGMPAVAAAAGEIVDHLEKVQKAEREAEGRVLLNLQVRERAPGKR